MADDDIFSINDHPSCLTPGITKMGSSIQNVKDSCRLYGKHHNQILSIYANENGSSNLEHTILKFLPFINLNKSDFLPKYVCNISSTMTAFNDLWKISRETNEKLNSLNIDAENKLKFSSEINQEILGVVLPISNVKRSDSNQGYNNENCIENSSILLNTLIQPQNPIYNKDRSDSFKSNSTIDAPCYFDHNYAAPVNLKSKWFQLPVPVTQKHTADYTYPTCQKIAVDLLTQPLKSLPEQKSFICETCSVLYDEKHLLTKHIKDMYCQNVTLQSPPIICEKCGRKFRLKAQLDKHRCRQPPEKVTSLAEVKKQKREFYNRFCEIMNGEYFYKCDQCSYYTTSKDNKLSCFQNHYKIHNTGFDVQCNLCVKTFRMTTAMKNHVDIVHHRLKKYSCSECGKKFVLLGTLKSHLLIHKGERPLICHQCGKSFRRVSALRVHTRYVHLKEKNHQCPVCPKLYPTASLLKMHMSRHLGVRDYACQVCHKEFFTQKYLMEHLKSVHNGNSSLLCVTCGKAYKSKRTLEFHQKIGHGTSTE